MTSITKIPISTLISPAPARLNTIIGKTGCHITDDIHQYSFWLLLAHADYLRHIGFAPAQAQRFLLVLHKKGNDFIIVPKGKNLLYLFQWDAKTAAGRNDIQLVHIPTGKVTIMVLRV